MKFILPIVVIAALSAAGDDGCTCSDTGIVPPETTDDITVNLEGSFDISGIALGLDAFENNGATVILAVNNIYRYVQGYDPTTGSPSYRLDLDSENSACFGVAWNNDVPNSVYHTNDWEQSILFFTPNHGINWLKAYNPVENKGRGFDFDGANYWITNDDIGICRFLPGAGDEMYNTPEITSQISGLATFPYMGGVGIAVTSYNVHNIWFYHWDGTSTSLNYLGSVPCPLTVYKSLGLAYSEISGNLFMAYRATSANDYSICEISFSISGLALRENSWAAIKSSF